MTRRIQAGALSLALSVAAALPVTAARPDSAFGAEATPPASQTFASPDAAVAALIDAVQQENEAKLLAILGPGSKPLVESGDHVADVEGRKKFLAAYQEKHSLSATGPDQMTLIVGANDYPVPLPIVQSGGQWHFDSRLGAQEMIDRRIGRNEIAAIRVALANVDAQKLYAKMAQDANGTSEYAQHIVSAPGKHDGLYWPGDADEQESPLAPLVEQAEDEGYPGEIVSGKPMPYQGYNFRILKGQGWSAPGGKMDYVADGHMTRGFGLIAWPARYGASGIMTFIVDADGVVFQKDLGPKTESLAAAITLYDPDLSWARVDVEQ